MQLNEKLNNLRVNNKLTVEFVANEFNVSETDIISWEENNSQPSIDQLRQLASFYDVTVESLIDDNSDIILNKKSLKRKLNGLKLIAKLLYFFTIGLTITYFMSYLSTVLLQKPSLRLMYGVETKFVFPIVGFIGVIGLFLFIVLFSSKLATRLSKQTKGFGVEILVLLLLPFILLLSELFSNLQNSMLLKQGTDNIHLANMFIGCKAMINGIAPLFIFALMMSLCIKILDKSPYQPKLINRKHQVWHNFVALMFGFNLGTFSLPFFVAYRKEQAHVCEGSKIRLFYTLGFIGSFWTTIVGILVVSLLAFIRSKLNY